MERATGNSPPERRDELMTAYNEFEECEGAECRFGLGGRIDSTLVYFQAAGIFAMMGGEQVLPRSSSCKTEDDETYPSIFECIHLTDGGFLFVLSRARQQLNGTFPVTPHHARLFSALCMNPRSEGGLVQALITCVAGIGCGVHVKSTNRRHGHHPFALGRAPLRYWKEVAAPCAAALHLTVRNISP